MSVQEVPLVPRLIDFDALMQSSCELEPLPQSVTRLASLLLEPDTSMGAIVEVISIDQALTASLLRQANSASSASSNSIGTVREAVVRLGTGTVLSLALSSCVARKMNAPLPAYDLVEGQLWAHSVAASLDAETIRTRAEVSLPGEVITAALIHDIGKLVMARHLDVFSVSYLNQAQRGDGLRRFQAEAAILEVHHGEIGGLIVQHWGLPDTIRVGVQYHHDPAVDGSPLCYAVCLADIVGHDVVDVAAADGNENDMSVDLGLRAEAMGQLGLPENGYDELLAAVMDRYHAFASRYLSEV